MGLKEINRRNIPQEVIIPRVDSCNGRLIDALSGFPIPPQYVAQGPAGVDASNNPQYGFRDTRFPHRIDRVTPDLFGVSIVIEDGDNNAWPTGEDQDE